MGCQGLPNTPTYLHNVESKDPPGTHTFPHGYGLKLLIPRHGWSTKKTCWIWGVHWCPSPYPGCWQQPAIAHDLQAELLHVLKQRSDLGGSYGRKLGEFSGWNKRALKESKLLIFGDLSEFQLLLKFQLCQSYMSPVFASNLTLPLHQLQAILIIYGQKSNFIGKLTIRFIITITFIFDIDIHTCHTSYFISNFGPCSHVPFRTAPLGPLAGGWILNG